MSLPLTEPSLLIRLRDPRDGWAWERFSELYAPIVYGFAKRRGLQDADAADLTQDVLRTVVHAARSLEYDPALGKFRTWLFKIVNCRIVDFWRGQKKESTGTGDSGSIELLQNQPDRNGESTDWDMNYYRQVFHYAAWQVRGDFQDTTWQAFWRTAVDGEAAKAVAEPLGMSVAAVYLAKARVMSRLKEQIHILLGDEPFGDD